MDVRFIHPFEELDASQTALAGGKGASLGELQSAGVPVPPGFVVGSAAFEAFIEAADPESRLEATLRDVASGRLGAEAAAQRIASLLEDATVPESVAEAVTRAVPSLAAERVSVRSSATCEDSGASAWAGQLETFLAVEPADVVERVRGCWLSGFTESALAYGATEGYGAGRFGVAVVVQAMVASEISGIGFSVHPVTQEAGVALIEACLGLGEAIVSGQIDPDQVVVERDPPTILDRSIGRQQKGLFLGTDGAGTSWRPLGGEGAHQKLTDAQALEYAAILDRIEAHFGHPVDTEWAIERGRLQVLQARPITSLADEYREPVVDVGREWSLLVRRPMTLVEVSIWSHWMDSHHAGATLGIHADRALSIQDDAGIANDYLSTAAMEAGIQHVIDLHRSDRRRLIETLQHGHALSRDAKTRIERGAADFRDLDEGAAFFIEIGQYATGFPAWTLIACDQAHIDDPEVRELAVGLRSHSLYPSTNRRVVEPLVAEAARAVGFSQPDQAAHLVTWEEMRSGTVDRQLLEERLEAVRAGRRFVYQVIPDNPEQVRFVSQTAYLIMRLARQRRIERGVASGELRGQAAWPGTYRGRARVILSADAVGQTLEDGEVLVSIQSSPALMPLLRRAGAIVTDEGGVACHAAIICRELQRPTLIGTGSATSTIRTGDLIEVDAYDEVVRILERAE